MAKKRKTAPPDDETFDFNIEEIKDALLALTAQAKSKADDAILNAAGDMKFESAALRKKAEKYVAKEPIKCITAAFIIGVLIGYLFNKSS